MEDGSVGISPGTYVTLIDGDGNTKLCLLPLGAISAGTTLVMPTQLSQLSAQPVQLISPAAQVVTNAGEAEEAEGIPLLGGVIKTEDVSSETVETLLEDDVTTEEALIDRSLESGLTIPDALPIHAKDVTDEQRCVASAAGLIIPVLDSAEASVCGQDVLITDSQDVESTVCVSEFSEVMHDDVVSVGNIGAALDSSALTSGKTDPAKVMVVDALEQPRVVIVDVMPDVAKYQVDCIQGAEVSAMTDPHLILDSDIPNEVAAEETVEVTVPSSSTQSEISDLTPDQILALTSNVKTPLNNIKWNPIIMSSSSPSPSQPDGIQLACSTAELMALMQSGAGQSALEGGSSAEDSDFTGLTQLLGQQANSSSSQGQREPTIRDIQKRERDKQKKRALRMDPAYRGAEKVKAQSRMKARRCDPEYRERERIRDRLRRRQTRLRDSQARQQERERDRKYQRQHRLENNVIGKTQVEVVDYGYLLNPIVPEEYS